MPITGVVFACPIRRSGRSPADADRIGLSLFVFLSGCATFSPDGGMTPVALFAGDVLHKEVAVIRNPGRRGARTRSRAENPPEGSHRGRRSPDRVAQQPRPAGRVQRARQRGSGNGRRQPAAQSDILDFAHRRHPVPVEIERQIAMDILALATLPIRSEIAAKRFRRAQLRAMEETLRLAAETRRAYYRAVAGRELSALLAQADDTAKTTAQLAIKLGETGSLNKLDQAREQVFYAETTADLATVRQEAASARERLTRLHGLVGQRRRFPAAGRPAAAAGRGRRACLPSRWTRSRGASTCRPPGSNWRHSRDRTA